MNRVQHWVLTNSSKHSIEPAFVPLLTDALNELKFNCWERCSRDSSVGKGVAERLGLETVKIKPGTQVLVCTRTFVIHYVYNKSTTVFGCLTRLIGSSDMDLEGTNSTAVVPCHVPDSDFEKMSCLYNLYVYDTIHTRTMPPEDDDWDYHIFK
jgi:hypothetical protein